MPVNPNSNQLKCFERRFWLIWTPPLLWQLARHGALALPHLASSWLLHLAYPEGGGGKLQGQLVRDLLENDQSPCEKGERRGEGGEALLAVLVRSPGYDLWPHLLKNAVPVLLWTKCTECVPQKGERRVPRHSDFTDAPHETGIGILKRCSGLWL